MATIVFPNTESQILLWSQVICLWAFITYLLESETVNTENKAKKDPQHTETDSESGSQVQIKVTHHIANRRTLIGSLALVLPGLGLSDIVGRILLAGSLLLIVGFSSYGRAIVTRRWARMTAEWEVLVNALALVTSGIIIASYGLQVNPETSLFNLPISNSHLSITFFVTGAALFLTEGGTRFTRAILEKTGTAPKSINYQNADVGMASDSQAGTIEVGIDKKEYNRGKYIGNLERLLVLAVVLLGSYETIGFIIAGKGLIRAKEFEERDFAEYFLIGTLTSIFIAIAVGLLIKFAASKILAS